MKAIQTTSELTSKKHIVIGVTDVRGGVSLQMSNLTAGKVIPQGTPITKPTDRIRTVCKQSVVLTGSTTTAIKVESATNLLKVGNFIGTKTDGKAYAITSIDTASGVDTLNVGTAIDTPVVGGFIYEMAAEAAATTSALKNTANTILKNAMVVPSDTMVIFKADAWVRADVLENAIGSEYLASLSGVIECAY